VCHPVTSKRLNSKQKLAKVFRNPDIIGAIAQYDRHLWICEQCFNKLEENIDNSSLYYSHYWQNFYYSKEAANKLVKQHNLEEFGKNPITMEPRDDGDEDEDEFISYNDKGI